MNGKIRTKKQEVKNRKQFICEAAGIVGKSLLQHAMNTGKNTTYRLKTTNNNYYYSMHGYVADLQILIFRSGDIDILLKEAFHADIRIRIVEYKDAEMGSEKTLVAFQEDISQIIYDYLFCDWHIFMDYMSEYKEGEDWREVYRFYRADSPDWKERK